MAVLYITEYASMANVSGAIGQLAQEPALATTTYAIGASAISSNAFSPGTAFIRVETDAIVAIEIGANPTAIVANTTTHAGSKRMNAGDREYFGVVPGHKLSLIATT